MGLIAHDKAVLLVVDLQERLLAEIAVAEAIVAQTRRLIRVARELEVPVVVTEQYPKGLGHTVAAVADELRERPIEKVSFGCFGDLRFVEALERLGRRQLVLTGAETHVCVLQTALGAVQAGYEAFVVSDAVGSRAQTQYEAGLTRMAREDVGLVTAEMAIFEMLGRAASPEFKRVLPIIKEKDALDTGPRV